MRFPLWDARGLYWAFFFVENCRILCFEGDSTARSDHPVDDTTRGVRPPVRSSSLPIFLTRGVFARLVVAPSSGRGTESILSTPMYGFSLFPGGLMVGWFRRLPELDEAGNGEVHAPGAPHTGDAWERVECSLWP